MALTLTSALFVSACPSPQAADDAGVPDDAGSEAGTPRGPTFTPCPDGWVEEVPQDEGGATTCEPWPNGIPVAPPALVCPSGWRRVAPTEPEGVPTCDPWPEEGPADCPPNQWHFPGEPACRAVGTACTDDDWASNLPQDATVLYVRQGAPAGGTGARDAPFGSIADAVLDAGPGTILALSKGTFAERVLLGEGVTLWGACVAETLVTHDIPNAAQGVVTVRGRDAVVRNLRISGNRAGVWIEGAGRTATLQDIVVAGASGAGVVVWNGASLAARGLVIIGTRDDGALTLGVGLDVESGGTADVGGAIVMGSPGAGVGVWGAGSGLHLSDAWVGDTEPPSSDSPTGRGMVVAEGAHAEVERAVFERNQHLGIMAAQPDTDLRLVDVIVRETRVGALELGGGRALEVASGARAEVERAVLERNRTLGMLAFGEATQVQLRDLVVRDISPPDGGLLGRGLSLQEGASVTIERVVVERSHDTGIFVGGAGTSLVLIDAVVRDTSPEQTSGEIGRGFSVQEGARAEITRARIERNHEVGILADGADTVLTVSDAVVRDTLAQQSDGASGRGLSLQSGVRATVSRVLIERNRMEGIRAVGAGTQLLLSDAVVRDTESRPSDGTFGRGLSVEDGAEAQVERARFLRNREASVFAYAAGATARLSNTSIRETLPRACAVDACRLFGAGIGAGAYGGASLVLERFEIVSSALCGLQLAHGVDTAGLTSPFGGTADLRDGLVSRNPIGVNLAVEDFDITRLQAGVRYQDNERDFDSSALPVPSAAGPP